MPLHNLNISELKLEETALLLLKIDISILGECSLWGTALLAVADYRFRQLKKITFFGGIQLLVMVGDLRNQIPPVRDIVSAKFP